MSSLSSKMHDDIKRTPQVHKTVKNSEIPIESFIHYTRSHQHVWTTYLSRVNLLFLHEILAGETENKFSKRKANNIICPYIIIY